MSVRLLIRSKQICSYYSEETVNEHRYQNYRLIRMMTGTLIRPTTTAVTTTIIKIFRDALSVAPCTTAVVKSSSCVTSVTDVSMLTVGLIDEDVDGVDVFTVDDGVASDVPVSIVVCLPSVVLMT